MSVLTFNFNGRSLLSRVLLFSYILVQGSPSGGGHVPPWGDASRMTSTDDDETCIYYAEGTNILAQVHI